MSNTDLVFKQAKERQQRWIKLFESKEGKECLTDLEKICLGNKLSYVRGDSHETAFREGRRDVLLVIKHILNEDIGQKEKLYNERNKT